MIPSLLSGPMFYRLFLIRYFDFINSIFVKTDVTNEEDITALVDKTVVYGRLDYAFNKVGLDEAET